MKTGPHKHKQRPALLFISTCLVYRFFVSHSCVALHDDLLIYQSNLLKLMIKDLPYKLSRGWSWCVTSLNFSKLSPYRKLPKLQEASIAPNTSEMLLLLMIIYVSLWHGKIRSKLRRHWPKLYRRLDARKWDKKKEAMLLLSKQRILAKWN